MLQRIRHFVLWLYVLLSLASEIFFEIVDGRRSLAAYTLRSPDEPSAQVS